MKNNIFIVVGLCILIGYFIGLLIQPATQMPVEIRDITMEDLELLIDRAKVSGNTSLEAILHAVAGALETKTLSELANYTTKYSKHMLEEHYKSDKPLNKLGTI